MKKAKRIMGLLLALALVITILPMQTQAATPKLNKTKATISVGKTVTLKVNNYSKKIKWSTSNKKVATVTTKGKVKGISKGTATITAKAGNKSLKCKITVKEVKTETVLKDVYTIGDQLKTLGLVSGTPIMMDASYIGGLNGIKYKEENVEIYQYDTSSESYKELVENGYVIMTLFNQEYEFKASAINGPFVLFCEESENKDNIIKAFSELK